MCSKQSQRNHFITLIFLFMVIVNWGVTMGCTGTSGGTSSNSPHQPPQGFRNTNPDFSSPNFWVRTKFLISRIWTTTVTPRKVTLPVIHNDGTALREPSPTPTVTWVGHSTLLIQLDGLNILTDPHWSQRASPVSFAGPKRLVSPGLPLNALPPIHLVVISHNHYDHLDTWTIDRLASAHQPMFLVPLGLKEWFQDRGVNKVDELDWWESRTVEGVTVICLPAQHFSGRTLWDRNETLWSSWAILSQHKRFFFSGDTGYYDVFKEIGARLGPFDLAAISIGAYLPRNMMQMTHMTPEEALHMFLDLRGKRFLGIHWGTFDLTEEPFLEPPMRLEAESRRLGLASDSVWVFKHGETGRW